MFRYIIACLGILMLLGAAQCQAESLYPANSQSMFQEQKASRAGDLLTIVIVEEASSSLQESSDYNKKFDHNNVAAMGPFPINLVPAASYSAAQKGSAGGSNTITSSLATKLTATVTGVQANGNLEVKAVRQITTNGEKQEIVLTGVVRQQDVGNDNTVMSTYLSDVNIDYKGKGPIGDRQKEGIISKILRFFF